MDTQVPELHTRQLRLRAFCSADCDDVFAYASNPRVARFTSWQAHQSRADSQAFLAWVLQRRTEPGLIWHTWAICAHDDQRAMGSIGFRQLSPTHGRIDFALAEAAWGQGIMTEAARAVISWAFEQLPAIETIMSGGLSENRGSMRVLEKCGMQLEEQRSVRFAQLGDEEREVAEYAITRALWRKANSER
jgi:[ribosomal protein S5]-alanine N-acetyltransferase